MNLRLRLIVAFFLLSVVPLGAVTLYSYRSNAGALRDAAQHEAEMLAGELTQRMQIVTAQLTERVGHLMDMNEAQPTAVVALGQLRGHHLHALGQFAGQQLRFLLRCAAHRASVASVRVERHRAKRHDRQQEERDDEANAKAHENVATTGA